ncbi:alpha/beta fold hydrolase [Acidimangrovimonas pyrenivorans]|uniref:Alpha/beta fold hydrolase n=1 Tax=Acidimangrovimonas pyrenivorans TaxID=2030798 RepID=A0ABV7AEN0_9RHOB
MIRIEGRIVHAHIAGDGPDLILLHGASGNAREFTFRLMDRLKGRFRVIAFDRPGLGWSDALGPEDADPAAQVRVLRKAAERLGAFNPIVLGQSYGGAVALSWALEHPDDIAALVVVSGASNPWTGGLGAWYRATSVRPGAAVLVPLATAWASEKMTAKLVAEIFAPDPVPEGYVDHVAVPLTLRRKVLIANARQVNGLLPHIHQMSTLYGQIRQPLEIVHGTADSIVPIGIHSERLLRQVPGANLTRLEGVGHMPHHTNPDDIIAAIHRAAARAGLH